MQKCTAKALPAHTICHTHEEAGHCVNQSAVEGPGRSRWMSAWHPARRLCGRIAVVMGWPELETDSSSKGEVY